MRPERSLPPGVVLRIRGRGPDVVLVHGALGDYRQWQEVGAALGRRYRVTALSRRFHWPHACPADAPYTFAGHRRDVEAVMACLDPPCHLVGHSYGAGVALLAALKRPELVATLTLVELPLSTLVSDEAEDFAQESASREAMSSALRSSVDAGANEDAVSLLFDWLQGGEGGFHRLSATVRDGLLENAATIGPTYASPPPPVSRADIATLSMPVLVLRGERTRPWYRLIAEAAAGSVPGAETGVIAGAAHMTIVENPADTAALIERFIERHLGRADLSARSEASVRPVPRSPGLS